MTNIDTPTVKSFGTEWSAFTQAADELSEDDRLAAFDSYFAIFPWQTLPPDARGADIGCGSGRWAAVVAPRVGMLYAVDPSAAALSTAASNLAGIPNATVVQAEADALPVADASLDFAYCLGVLHHVPDTEAALRAIGAKLKPGAPFLLYLYYRFDNRPRWYEAVWWLSNIGRIVISKLPHRSQFLVSGLIAGAVYWPLARCAAILSRLGALPRSWPLSFYRDKGFYMMRTDAFDQFCTPLEKRFSRSEIEAMLRATGFERVRFSDGEPYWVSVSVRSHA